MGEFGLVERSVLFVFVSIHVFVHNPSFAQYLSSQMFLPWNNFFYIKYFILLYSIQVASALFLLLYNTSTMHVHLIILHPTKGLHGVVAGETIIPTPPFYPDPRAKQW